MSENELLELVIEKLPRMNIENRVTDRWVKVELAQDLIKAISQVQLALPSGLHRSDGSELTISEVLEGIKDKKRGAEGEEVMKSIEERIKELVVELEYQTGERIAAEDLQKANGNRLMAIKQHIKVLGEEIHYLQELKATQKLEVAHD